MWPTTRQILGNHVLLFLTLRGPWGATCGALTMNDGFLFSKHKQNALGLVFFIYKEIVVFSVWWQWGNRNRASFLFQGLGGLLFQWSSYGLWCKHIYRKKRGVWETEGETKKGNRKDRSGSFQCQNNNSWNNKSTILPSAKKFSADYKLRPWKKWFWQKKQ